MDIINRVAEKFMRRRRWNPRWEIEDVRQELLCFWIQTKDNGWKQPENWQQAMGHCLKLHLKDLLKHAYAQKRQAELLSLDLMLDEGHDFADGKMISLPFDFLELLNSTERRICNLLLEGKTKLEVRSLLKRSKSFINERLNHARIRIAIRD